MAINLNPGADASLVSVAYRAAMANAPKDYSDTLENAADSYEKTMEAQSKMWGNFAQLGASIGVDMVKNAKELDDYSARAAGLNPEHANMFMDEIYGNKDAQKELSFWRVGIGDRETRKKRQELKIEQKELFAEIDLAIKSISVGTEAVASGAYDASINEKESEMVNAIIKSNLKDKVTKEGNMAKLTRDEKSGELIYTMYKEDGTASMIGGKPQTMTIKEFSKSIATNVDDKGAGRARLNALNDGVSKLGSQSLSGVYDPQMRQMNSNKLDAIIQTPADLGRAFRTKFGYSDTSFFDDLTTKGSKISLDLYNTLLSVTGSEDAEGELALTGVTEGIVDADNSGGISQKELLNAENYSLLSGNILGMIDPAASKAYFKEYTNGKLEEAFNYGHSLRPPAPGSGKDPGTGNGTNPHGILLNKKGEYKLGFASKGTNYIQGYDPGYVTRKIDYLKNGTPIDFQGTNYTFRTVDGESQWYENYGYKEGGGKTEGVGIGRVIGSAEDMARDVFSVDDPIFTSIVTEKEPERIDDKTGLTSGDNPFGDAGTGEVAVVPDKFIKAVGNDDKKVVEYLKTMKVPGLKIKGAGYGTDNIVLEINDKKKVFIVDPNWEDDDVRATEIWQWLYSNWSASESVYSGSAADIVAEIE